MSAPLLDCLFEIPKMTLFYEHHAAFSDGLSEVNNRISLSESPIRLLLIETWKYFINFDHVFT